MYISNTTQPNSRKKILQPTDFHLSPYYITPCAKTIGALLLVLSSTAWANNYSPPTQLYTPNIPYTAEYIQYHYDLEPPQRRIPDRKSYVRKGTEGWQTRLADWKDMQANWKAMHADWEENYNEREAFYRGAMEHWEAIEKEWNESTLQQRLAKETEKNKKALTNGVLNFFSSKPPIDDKAVENNLFNEIDAAITETSNVIQAAKPTIVKIFAPESEDKADKDALKKIHIEQLERQIEEQKVKLNDMEGETEEEQKKLKALQNKLESLQQQNANDIKKSTGTLSETKKTATSLAPNSALIINHNPQVASYIANQIAAQQMFMADDLRYRQGETHYIDPIAGEEKVSGMWLNTSAAKNRFNSGNGQLQTKSNRYAIQLGGTLGKWSSGGDDQGILGVTTGFGQSTSHSNSKSSHYQASGSIDGYNLGLYSIWYANNQTRLGSYIDLLTQYSWFNNQVKTQQLISNANYKSHLFTSALETGHKMQLFEKADARLFIQPQAKVSWQRMHGIQHKETTGTQIMIEGNNAITTKFGIRTMLELDIDTLSSNKTLQLSPSFEANWIHKSNDKGVWLGSTNITPQGNSNIVDLKLGIEANIDKNLLLWTHLGHQLGGHKYSDTQATLGANYRF